MKQLYPLLFNPIFKEKIWGGTKLKTILDKKILSNKIGESWEISTIGDDVSIVKNGKFCGSSLVKLIHEYKSNLVGSKVYSRFGDSFPLLIKFIDANQDLSIQVHPNDFIAKQIHNSFGKTEMWYICDVEPNSALIAGLIDNCTSGKFEKHLLEDNLSSIMRYEHVKEGDSFFIPAGIVHGIGKGILLAEIQQTSDLTYRIYDYNRRDENSNLRELHIESAKKVINFSAVGSCRINSKSNNGNKSLVSCIYFTTNLLQIRNIIQKDYSHIDSFVVFMCVNGEGMVVNLNGEDIPIRCGDTVLIPACINRLSISTITFCEILEIYIN